MIKLYVENCKYQIRLQWNSFYVVHIIVLSFELEIVLRVSMFCSKNDSQ
jgi:hypothetical protein